MPFEPVIEATDEGHPAHLAVRDDVDPRLDLVLHGEADGVLVGFLEIDRPERDPRPPPPGRDEARRASA